MNNQATKQFEFSLSRKFLLFLPIFFLFLISFISALPSPILTTTSSWQVTSATGQEAQLKFWTNGTDKKVLLGWLPPDNSCAGWTDKAIYGRNGLPIKDDKNKDIILKCETAKCGGKNCYHISLTNAQAINIDDYIKLGNNSIISEWLDSTYYIYPTDTYDRQPFQIEVYECDGTKIEYPDMNWTEPLDNTEQRIQFNAQVGNTSVRDCIMFRVNQFEESYTCTETKFFKTCTPHYSLTFEDFEAKNTITEREVKIYKTTLWDNIIDTFPFIWRAWTKDLEITHYELIYRGTITDLDPALIQTFKSSSNLVFTNRTEATSTGVRLQTPILSMEFNEPEGMPMTTYNSTRNTYVKDGSVNNNYAFISGLVDNEQWISGEFGNALQFDGINDYVTFGNNSVLRTNETTLSVWVYSKSFRTCNSGCVIAGKYNTANQRTFYMGYTPGNVWCIVSKDGTYTIGTTGFPLTAPISLPENTWVNLVCSYSPSAHNVSFYYNGVINYSVYDADYTNTFASTANFSIGNNLPYSATQFFRGMIDEVMLFNRNLSGSEINELYTNQSTSLDAFAGDTNLAGYWRLNATSGLTAIDDKSTSNGSLVYYDLSNPIYNSTGGYDGSGAYEFDGSNDYIQSNLVSSLTTYTISARIKNSTASSWSHVVWASDGVNYTNGILSNPTEKPINVSSTNVKIGIQTATYFNGTIDQVRIYGRLLTSAEVLELYNGTTNNSIIKYDTQGDFKSLVFYNSSITYWNITLTHSANPTGNVADTNGINLSEPSLVSYWNLDNSYNDVMGRNNGSCAIGTNCPANATGLSSGAMWFSGDSGGIDITNSSLGFDVQLFTISAWVKSPTLTTGTNVIFSKGPTNTQYALFFHLSNKVYFRTYNSADVLNDQVTAQAVTGVTNNAWYHVVAEYNGTNKNLFINGVLLNSTAYSQTLETGRIGQRIGTDLNTYLNGTIDEVLFYNRSLTETEVMQLYKSGLSQYANTNATLQYRTANTYNISDTSLKHLFSFNNDNSTNAIDELNITHPILFGNLTTSPASIDNGTVGMGYYFDGVNDYMNWTENLTSSAFTVCTWAKPANTDAVAYLYWNAGGTIRLYQTTTGDGLWTFYLDSVGTAGKSLASTSAPTGNWQYLCGIWDGATISFYVDANLQTTDTATGLTLGDGGHWIGVINTLTNDYNGLLDEYRIYNRSLSATEIQNLYELGSYHISDWSAWSSEQVVTDNLGIMTSTTGSFMQFKTNLYTNTTQVSPYVFDYIVSNGSAPPTGEIEESPQFSNFGFNYSNGTIYNPTNIYTANATITSTNGTAGIEFNAINYSTTNISSLFTSSLGNLGVGTYSYYWWAFGNGTNHLYNISDSYYYTIVKANPSSAMSISGTTPISYNTTSNFAGSETNNGDSDCSYSLDLANKVYGVDASPVTFNYSTTGCTNYTEGSVTKDLTINKGNPPITMTSSMGWTIPAASSTTITGVNCPTVLTCNLTLSDAYVSNPYTTLFSAGSYYFKYNTTGDVNWSSYVYSRTLVSTASGEVTPSQVSGCRYKKLGYYNLKLPWIRQENCL